MAINEDAHGVSRTDGKLPIQRLLTVSEAGNASEEGDGNKKRPDIRPFFIVDVFPAKEILEELSPM